MQCSTKQEAFAGSYQIDGSRTDDESDATMHSPKNARPIIPNVNTIASWPTRRRSSMAHAQMIGKSFRKT